MRKKPYTVEATSHAPAFAYVIAIPRMSLYAGSTCSARGLSFINARYASMAALYSGEIFEGFSPAFASPDHCANASSAFSSRHLAARYFIIPWPSHFAFFPAIVRYISRATSYAFLL